VRKPGHASARGVAKSGVHTPRLVPVHRWCESLGMPQPEAWLKADDGSAGVAAILRHVATAQQIAVLAAVAAPGPGAYVSNTRNEERHTVFYSYVDCLSGA